MNKENAQQTSFCWSDGKFIQGRKEISSINFVLHYSAPSIWEGIRSYKHHTENMTNIVSLKEHIARLFDSAKIVNMQIPFTPQELEDACKSLVKKNGGGDLYLRPIAYATKDAESVSPQGSGISVDIYAFPIPELFKKDGIKMGFSVYTRGYPQFEMQAKATHNYPHLQLCQKEITMKGVDDVFLSDNDGYITEGLVTNVFIKKGRYVLTPPNDGSILPGITRTNIYKIFQSAEFKREMISNLDAGNMPILIAEKRLTKADLLTADEVFVCGTYAEVVPVVEVEGLKIGDGKPGNFTKLIRKAYKDSTRARGKYGVSLDKT